MRTHAWLALLALACGGDESNRSSGSPASTDEPPSASTGDDPGGSTPSTVTDSTATTPAPEDCVDDATFFEREVHAKVLTPVCSNCHTRDGLARNSAFVLEPTARPDRLEVDWETVEGLAAIDVDGLSLLIAKPTGITSHGGGRVIDEGGPEALILEGFLERLDAPVEDCPGEGVAYGDGLELLTPNETLRKAAILLVGRLPTPTEVARVDDGGEEALREVVRAMTDEEAFVARAQEWFNDLVLTDRYMDNTEAVDLLDEEQFPGTYWFEELDDDRYETLANTAIAREPMELLGHILRSDSSYAEILTADYTVVNAFSAASYGVARPFPVLDELESLAFEPATIEGIPHSGILTMPVYLNRYPSTATNRNRHRTWAFMRQFLATDLLLFAERPVDSSLSDMHNPTLNDPQCTVCHAVMDPIAGTFQNWNDAGERELPDGGWFPEMAVPGFGGVALPADERGAALAWMAQQAVDDGRFAIGAVNFAFEAVTGIEPIDGLAVKGDPTLAEAYAAQQAWVGEQAEAFRLSGHDLEALVVETVLSRYFRAVGDVGATVGDLELAGTAKLLTPEELDRKIRAVTGFVWAESSGTPYLESRYKMLYGGIDSDGVVERLTDPNGIMANIGLRMASEVACGAVPEDLVLPMAQRRLLPFVEATYVPETVDGFVIPEAEEAIRANLVHLHARIVGEHYAPSDPEIEISYALWRDTWLEGQALVAEGALAAELPVECVADTFDGESLPEELVVETDGSHTIRAWMAVTAYLLADHRFLVE